MYIKYTFRQLRVLRWQFVIIIAKAAYGNTSEYLKFSLYYTF